ncbi:F-box only protein 9-like [Haliotis asinina]|uniref:F-box only protein 9-like n=1 Tax=Haliotis asinina TaxID=109174 RepID=UPI003532103C
MSDEILPTPCVYEEERVEGRGESPSLEEELFTFREKWKNELEDVRSQRLGHNHALKGKDAIEKEATRLFLLGSEAERSGAFYEAIQFYKKAMHLVPDIESKIDVYAMRSQRERQDSETSLEDQSLSEENDECLLTQLQELSVGEKTFCQPSLPQRATHISSLPLELIIYIFRWVVSNDLDIRSLENLSLVCRGFYVCARDEELWRIACEKVWGENTRHPRKYGGSWRTMFIEKPHPLFHGCYISRTGYVRQGEQGLDNFYRPFHLVYYYRMVRFFPDGTILMVCTPEDPSAMVTRMRDRSFRQQGLMSGYYKLQKNKISAVLKRDTTGTDNTYHRYKRRQQPNPQSEGESTFFVEFELNVLGRRAHTKLVWSKYFNRIYYKSTGEEVINNFDLKPKNFPPLIFSRVKSYTAMSDTLLAS